MTSQLELVQKPFIELQIEALVQENSIKPKKVGDFIAKLESRILSVSSLDYNKLLKKKRPILPLIGRPNASSSDDDYPKVLKFIPPEKLIVVGGFKTLTAIKRANHVDLAVPMPSSCLEKKDIKNQRYQQKRALYLAQLGQLLNCLSQNEGDPIEKLEFRYHQGDFLKPILLITPRSDKLNS